MDCLASQRSTARYVTPFGVRTRALRRRPAAPQEIHLRLSFRREFTERPPVTMSTFGVRLHARS